MTQILTGYNGSMYDDVITSHTQDQGCLKWQTRKYLIFHPPMPEAIGPILVK